MYDQQIQKLRFEQERLRKALEACNQQVSIMEQLIRVITGQHDGKEARQPDPWVEAEKRRRAYMWGADVGNRHDVLSQVSDLLDSK